MHIFDMFSWVWGFASPILHSYLIVVGHSSLPRNNTESRGIACTGHEPHPLGGCMDGKCRNKYLDVKSNTAPPTKNWRSCVQQNKVGSSMSIRAVKVPATIAPGRLVVIPTHWTPSIHVFSGFGVNEFDLCCETEAKAIEVGEHLCKTGVAKPIEVEELK